MKPQVSLRFLLFPGNGARVVRRPVVADGGIARPLLNSEL